MPTETNIREALRQVIDPELGLNIVDLGLVYRIEIDGTDVRIVMTMTSPACPLSEYLKELVDSTIRRQIPDVGSVDVVLVLEPPWNPDMMSDAGRRHLNGDE
jgi:metal-sulfur cluster biosynthetic enzyme